ncbi:MAG: DUF433 domain-containing protein [Candidatus Hydrogenedentes bacterium]|nr:DUF433 domain-containing protein [Candidatus Hydrogenedentota bacterium]
MSLTVLPETPPLREETDGALRVGNTRVLLEMVIQAFEDGATPETIVQQYPTLSLPEVYAVIAYYLRHPEESAEYLGQRQQQAEEIWHKIDQHQRDLSDIRARLLARRRRD